MQGLSELMSLALYKATFISCFWLHLGSENEYMKMPLSVFSSPMYVFGSCLLATYFRGAVSMRILRKAPHLITAA